MENFERELSRLNNAISKAEQYQLDLTAPILIDTHNFLNFNDRRRLYYQRAIENSTIDLKKHSLELNNLVLFDISNEPKIRPIIDTINSLKDAKTLQELKTKVDAINFSYKTLRTPKKKVVKETNVKFTLPQEISEEINADLNEINKCFDNGCYRSATVLCGRILETALHRKYFEVAGEDILEKNPGIGLGKLVAKLTERNVKFDPGITQQIHLINQVRVFTVHKKQEVFYPSKDQAEAIILFTSDIIKKLFK